VAADKLNEFTPEEQEMVNYILSFVSHPRDVAYANLHMRRFVSMIQYLPRASRTSARALELGSYLPFTPAIKKYGGYSEIKCANFGDSPENLVECVARQEQGTERHIFQGNNFDAERMPFPYPDGHFQLVLCCEMIEHLSRDPMHLLWECNRVLEADGYLLLTTPNITGIRSIEGLLTGYAPYLMSQYNVNDPPGQHHREYAPCEIDFALRQAGFTVDKLETKDVWLRSNPVTLDLLRQMRMPTDLRGDNIFALARKTTAPIERYPKELYVIENP
jgi:SAM-dependent methyltransferase